MASDGSGLAQLTHVEPGDWRLGEGSWTPDGTRIRASLGVVNFGGVRDAKIGWVDSTTGEITPTGMSGAMPSLQATR